VSFLLRPFTNRPRLLELVGVTAFTSLVTIVLTWPQALHPTLVVDHFDPYFSVWRLGHVAHALGRQPIDLFEGNIFYPSRHVLAYSDAMLLQGTVATPLLWAHLSPTFVYNLLLFVGFVGSGVGMFVLARHLTGSPACALVAAMVFTALPYRVEHLMHLELQWAMFIPLSLWAVHRTMESGLWRHGLLLGLFLTLQFLSCIYYGVFLSITLVLFVPILLTVKGHVRFRAYAPPLLGGAALAMVLISPYASEYVRASTVVGARPLDEIARYSASPISYLATSSLNRLWGWTADLWGSPELRLFPGLLAILAVAPGIWHPRPRLVLLYGVTAVVVIWLSFGMNGRLYPALLGHVSALHGFRALARFGLVAGCSIAVLAALGVEAALMRVRRYPWSRALVPLVLVLMTAEYSNRRIPLSYGIDAAPADVYRIIKQAAPGVIVELPLPTPESLPGWDPYYEAWSVWHWRPMLNGYSGFYTTQYMDTLRTMTTFPDAQSIALLRSLDVRYVILHRALYTYADYTPLALKIGQTPHLKLWGAYKDSIGVAEIFEVLPCQPANGASECREGSVAK
jgi:hypothetical protein